MIRQTETKSICVDLIDVGHRYRQPSETEIEEMLKSIERDGLLTPIGLQRDGDTYRLVYGATRLAAVKKLGWPEVRAVLLEGSPGEFAIAEIIENLERRHLDRAERDELTKKLYELRTAEEQACAGEELRDTLSRNSSDAPKAHARAKVEGAKRGRPVTAEGRARKEIAAQTGQSIRSVQRATSAKPKGKPTPNKKAIDHDNARMERADQIERLLHEISKHLAACDRTDREMSRKNNKPYLDGWFDTHGKLRSEIALVQPGSVGVTSISPTVPASLEDVVA
jgi:ParB-like chromosome segregation protein Spo0J